MTPAKIMAPEEVVTMTTTSTRKAATMATSPMMMTGLIISIPIVMIDAAQEVQEIPAKIAVNARPATMTVTIMQMITIVTITEMMMTKKRGIPRITCSCTSSLLKLTKSEVITEAVEESMILEWTKTVKLKGQAVKISRKVIETQEVMPGIVTSDQTQKAIRTTEDVTAVVNPITEDKILHVEAEAPDAIKVPMAMQIDHTAVILPNMETKISTIPEVRTTLQTATNMPNPIMEVAITAMEVTLMISTRTTTVVVINLAITMAITMAATLVNKVATTTTMVPMTIATRANKSIKMIMNVQSWSDSVCTLIKF